MSTSPLSPTSVQPLVFALPAPDISAWRAGNTGTEGVWHFDSGRPGRRVMVSALVPVSYTHLDVYKRQIATSLAIFLSTYMATSLG